MNFKKITAVLSSAFMIFSLNVNAYCSSFADIDSHWAKNEIEAIVDKGILSGTSDDTFSPNQNITRGMLAVVVCNLLEEDPGDRVAFFSDIDNNKYYAPYVALAYERKILNGYEDQTFKADDPVTRQDLFTTIIRVYEYKNGTIEDPNYIIDYWDKNAINSYAVRPITLLSAYNYINGRNHRIYPTDYATRAELATLLYRLDSNETFNTNYNN